MGRQPLVCTIDPKKPIAGLAPVEGCVAARSMSGGFLLPSFVDSFAVSPAASSTSPIMYFFGSSDIDSNTERYKELVACLGSTLAKREER